MNRVVYMHCSMKEDNCLHSFLLVPVCACICICVGLGEGKGREKGSGETEDLG